jgi:hypothetical protein
MGQRIAYIKPKSVGSAYGGSIETVALEGGAPSPVILDPKLVSDVGWGALLWVRDGRLMYALAEPGGSGSNVWDIVTDPQTGKIFGKPAKMTNWYGIDAM